MTRPDFRKTGKTLYAAGRKGRERVTVADLHDNVMPDPGLTFGGKHHEICLFDPRRVFPETLKTILRQPAKPMDAER